GAILDRVLRRPVVSVIVAGGLLIALTIPAFGMHTAQPGLDTFPRNLPVMKTYDRIQKAFPGGPLPAVVVVQADDVRAPAVQHAIADLKKQALATGELRAPVDTDVSDNHRVEVVSLALPGTGTDSASIHAVETLRHDIIPATVGKVAGARADVTGEAA